MENKTSKNPITKPSIHDYQKNSRRKAIDMANDVEKKLSGKKLVKHPTLPKTYIYE